MSGIAGILHRDGAPIDPRLLARMTAFMAFRGPDARETRVSGPIGLGHALLRTAVERAGERQPASIGDDVWIVADCRLDGRAELIAALESARGHAVGDRSDAQLIAHAYQEWGRACVSRLLGDFAFAIWDGPRRQLFCARDHLGVKPFYYASRGDVFVFSNTLDCIRQHPCISERLDDGAIGDFLLVDRICEPSATAFADIRRLPAAHSLTLSSDGLAIERYWSVPTEGRIRYRHATDYTDHFAQLLSAAVRDRLRCESAGILMSGGVDATAVATTAHALHAAGATPALQGYTFVYDRLMADDERHYAGLASRAIGMPLECWPLDSYALFERWHDGGCRKPEPYHWPLEAATLDLYRHIARSSRVVLTGQGGDPLSYFGSLLCTPHFHTLLPDAVAYVLSRRRCPPLGLRTRARRVFARTSPAPGYPDWLHAGFAERAGLRDRFEQLSAETPTPHPTHARAHAMLSSPHWTWMFEGLDPGATGIPLEFRHPLFDVRLIEYVLAIPLMPWSVDKELLRSVSRGTQPNEVRLRRKSPVAGDPIVAHLCNGRPAGIDSTTAAPQLAEYVNLDTMRRGYDDTRAEQWWTNLRPVSLNLWLRHV